MKNKRKKRSWGYFIIVNTDTDFKENWARKVITDLLSALDNSFDSWNHKARVGIHFEDLTDEEVKYFENKFRE
jgi:hypothetical protein